MNRAPLIRALVIAAVSAQAAGPAAAIVYPIVDTRVASHFSTVFTPPVGTTTDALSPLDPGSLPLELQTFTGVSTRIFELGTGQVLSSRVTVTLASGDQQFATTQPMSFTSHGDGSFTELGTFSITGGTGSQAGATGGGAYRSDGRWTTPLRTAGTGVTTFYDAVIVTPGLPGTSAAAPFLPQQQLPTGEFCSMQEAASGSIRRWQRVTVTRC